MVLSTMLGVGLESGKLSCVIFLLRVGRLDELINGISEYYPKVQYLTVVLERILVYLVNRDLYIGREIVENFPTVD